jgi:hypothetical protein
MPVRMLGDAKPKKVVERIEAVSEDEYEVEQEQEQPQPQQEINEPVREKKKRVVSDEQKEILRQRLAKAREVRKQMADEKQKVQELLVKQREQELNKKIQKKVEKVGVSFY